MVRWRVIDLCAWFWSERGVKIAKQTLSRELRRMGYRKLSARPRHHAQAANAILGKNLGQVDNLFGNLNVVAKQP